MVQNSQISLIGVVLVIMMVHNPQISSLIGVVLLGGATEFSNKPFVGCCFT